MFKWLREFFKAPQVSPAEEAARKAFAADFPQEAFVRTGLGSEGQDRFTVIVLYNGTFIPCPGKVYSVDRRTLLATYEKELAGKGMR